jgi:hypothetical protein
MVARPRVEAHPFRPYCSSEGMAQSVTPLEAPPLTQPIMIDQESALLTEELAANTCGISRPTFRRWVAARCIQPVVVPGGGGRKLYRREDVDSFAPSI